MIKKAKHKARSERGERERQEDAADIEAGREAMAEMERTGEKPAPYASDREILQRLAVAIPVGQFATIQLRVSDVKAAWPEIQAAATAARERLRS
jgi:hypothetical protein